MKRNPIVPAYLVFLFLIALAGCPYRPDNDGKPAPQPDPPTPANVSAVERAANESFTAYRSNVADVCRDLRNELKSRTFKDAGEFFSEWEKRNKLARETSLTPYAEAVNEELFKREADGSWKTDGPIDVAEFDRVLMEAERGLRGK